MKLLYTTDLHGCVWKYERLIEIAQTEKADILVNGGDMLPKTGEIHAVQHDFISTFLPKYFEHLNKSGIHYLCCLGNDDLGVYDSLFNELCNSYPFVHNMARQKKVLNGFEFIGFNLVSDYPFRLKDRCRLDDTSSALQPQLGTGLLSRNDGFEEIADWEKYVRTLPSIEEELESLPSPTENHPSIYIMHMPPAGLGLDVCVSGFKAGSKSVYNFIDNHQPLLTLHGHIHESPQMSGKWKEKIGDTICIQPGQDTDLVYVVIDLDEMNFSRFTSPR